MQSTDHSQTTALITGGTQGLGLAVAHELVAAGCRQLILVGRSKEKGERAKAELEAKRAKVLFQSCDIAKADACEALLETAHAEFGPINALLNSAALTTRGSILDSSPELFDAHINTNLRAPFYLMQGVSNQLIAAGQSGSMVNILSVSAYVGQSFLAP